MDKQVQNLLRIIKFTPPILIIITAIFVLSFMNNEQKKELQNEQRTLEEQYLTDEKERVKSKVKTIKNYVKHEKEQAENLLKDDLKEETYKAHRIVLNIYNKNKDTKSKEEIIGLIKNSLEGFGFNQDRGYFFIYDIYGTNIFHPTKKEREGENFFYAKDSTGKFIVQESINIARSKEGEGFQSWLFHKPNNTVKEYKKIGFIKKFKFYNWFIGTGEYVEDFENDLKKRVLGRIKSMKDLKDNYIGIIDYKGTFLFHPSAKIQNKNIFNNKKFNHIKIIYKKLIEDSNKDADTFNTIELTVQDTKVKNEKKTIYSLKFDEWKWILYSGFNMSGINEIISDRKDIVEKKYNKYKNTIIKYGIILTIFLLIVSFFVSKLLERKFLKYRKSLNEQNNELEEKKKELEIIIQENSHPMILHREGGEILMINDEWAKLSGFTIKDTPTIDDWIEVTRDDEEIKASLKEHINSLYEITEKLDEGEFSFFNKGRKYVTWQISSSPLGLIDGRRTIITSAVDITELKKKNKIFLQQSKMAAMGEMLGNIAHQWRQPLSIISTTATGAKLQNELGLLNQSSLNSYFDSINDTAQYLSQTIDDFRGFFNPLNKIEIEFKISDAVTKSLNLVSAQFVAKDIEIIQNIEDIELEAVENELVQVLINILNNAKDALLKIEDQKRLIFINAYKNDTSIVIEVKDNAKGIPAHVIDRVFEPYFTTKHQSQGTGIGLYMSKEIIKNHLGGSLTVQNDTYTYESVEYVGAKFSIRITS